jgi:uncharacterized protein
MLLIPVRDIPPEGKPVDEALDAGTVRVEGEDEFALESGRLKGELERGDEETVQFRGHLSARLKLHCGRCLEGFDQAIEEDLDLFFMPQGPEKDESEEEQDVELADRDMVVAYYTDGKVDLAEMVREQVHLAVPLRQLCREDCQGLCPSCGVNRNLSGCDCKPEETADERLAPLRKLFDKGSS